MPLPHGTQCEHPHFGLARPLAALLLAAAPAAAQTPNIHIAAQGPWAVDCTAEAETGEKWCQVGTVLESDNPPYSLQFNYVRDTRMFFAMGSVWLSKVEVKVDGQPAVTIDRCLHGMCLLKGADADRLLQQMQSGARLSLGFQAQSRLPGPLLVDLAAFAPMYRRALAAPK